jgi:hypothetical protein
LFTFGTALFILRLSAIADNQWMTELNDQGMVS